MNTSSRTYDHDEMTETLQAMLRQESKHYGKKDFRMYQLHAMKDIQNQFPNQKLDPIDTSCRTKMCAWFQQICHFCQYDDDEMTEIIENAMNYMDRYVVTAQGSIALLDRNYYQGIAITCLYMATKLHASAAISANDMSQITRNVYTTEQIEDMEFHIYTALQWHVNPPTVSAFVSEYIKIFIAQLHRSNILSNTSDDTSSIIPLLQTVKDLVHTQRLATFSDEIFITVPASIIAYTAILSVIQQFLEVPVVHDNVFQDAFHSIQNMILAQSYDQTKMSSTIISVLHHLRQIVQPSTSIESSSFFMKTNDTICQSPQSPITTTIVTKTTVSPFL